MDSSRPLERLIYGAETEKRGTENVVVLGYDYWKKRFNGDASIVGQQVKMNGHSVTVIGVAPEGFHGTYALVDMQAYLPVRHANSLDHRQQRRVLDQAE